VDEEVGLELVEVLDGAALAQQLLQGREIVAGGRGRKHRKARRSDKAVCVCEVWGKPPAHGPRMVLTGPWTKNCFTYPANGERQASQVTGAQRGRSSLRLFGKHVFPRQIALFAAG